MKQIVFIGQAPARPGSAHQTAGTYLYPWLASIGFTDDQIQSHCHFQALVDIFPGSNSTGHAVPTKQQIADHLPRLAATLQSIQPDLIVPVGKLAIQQILQRNVTLDDIIGRQFSINPLNCLNDEIVCIPLSHPSGRSAWNHLHRDKVNEALRLIQLSASLDD